MNKNNSYDSLALFIAQISIVFIVICVSLVNLTFEWGNQNLWIVILTGSLGYVMPNPRIKSFNYENNKSLSRSNDSTFGISSDN